MKLQLFGLTLALLMTSSPLFAVQDSQPARGSVTEGQGAQRDTPPKAKRLGGNRLGGIKLKPKAPAQGPPAQGPLPAPAAPRTPTISAPAGRGGLTFEPGSQVVDFGEMIQGDVRETSFSAKSTGEDPLVIASVQKTCGCTRAEVSLLDDKGERQPYVVGQPIPAGTDFVVDARIDTTGKSHAFKSDITLVTNDPRRGIVFSLKANVQPALSLNPRSLNLGTMKATESKKGQVVITSEAFGAFKLSVDPNIKVKDLQVELVPTDPDEAGRSTRWVAKVEAGPNLPEGVLNRAIQLVSDLPQADKTLPDGSPLTYTAVLFTVGNVLGPVSVNPAHVSFGLLRPGQTLTRKATIQITDPDFSLDAPPALEIKGYGAEFPYKDDFDVSIVPVPGTKDWELVVNLLGMEQVGSGSFRGYIEIQLGHPAKPVLEVGFSGVVHAGVTQPK